MNATSAYTIGFLLSCYEKIMVVICIDFLYDINGFDIVNVDVQLDFFLYPCLSKFKCIYFAASEEKNRIHWSMTSHNSN